MAVTNVSKGAEKDQISAQDDRCTLNMLTWNVYQCSPGKEVTTGYAMVRDAVAKVITTAIAPKKCIALLQELNINKVKKWGFDNVFGMPEISDAKRKEAGVSSPESAAEGKVWIELGDILNLKAADGTLQHEEFVDRIHAQEVTIQHTSKPYNCRVLLVSCHLQYKIKNKANAIEAFFGAMCTKADSLKMTIILGGDFQYLEE